MVKRRRDVRIDNVAIEEKLLVVAMQPAEVLQMSQSLHVLPYWQRKVEGPYDPYSRFFVHHSPSESVHIRKGLQGSRKAAYPLTQVQLPVDTKLRPA